MLKIKKCLQINQLINLSMFESHGGVIIDKIVEMAFNVELNLSELARCEIVTN